MERRKRNIEAYRKAIGADGGGEAPKTASRAEDRVASAGDAGPKGLVKLTGKEASVRKAAKFLMLIGKEEASKVMRHFSEKEVEAVTREIAGIKRIESAEADRLLSEFGFLKESRSFPVGGVETARRILVNAFGDEKGRDLLSRSVPPEKEKFFGFLEDFEPHQIQSLFRNETPAVLAVILPYLSAETASRIVPLFEAEFRKELVLRVARKEKVSREVLLRMEDALREKARRLAVPADSLEVDGKSVLAEILKYVDISKEQEIIRGLEEEAPAVAEEIKELLFTIDVLEYLDDEDLRKILQSMDDRVIALILKGKSDSIRAKMLANLSQRRRGFVADEYRLLGPVPRREVDEATKEFLDLLKRLQAQGSIVFRKESDRYVE